MKTFAFISKSTSAIVTLSAEDFFDAENQLEQVVKDPFDFRVDNEEGELEMEYQFSDES